jgi:hypothetical protein
MRIIIGLHVHRSFAEVAILENGTIREVGIDRVAGFQSIKDWPARRDVRNGREERTQMCLHDHAKRVSSP